MWPSQPQNPWRWPAFYPDGRFNDIHTIGPPVASYPSLPTIVTTTSASFRPPLSATGHQPWFKTWIIPHTTAIYGVKARLGSALVAVVGGVRLAVSPEVVALHLGHFY
jgi:hypothetical protein